MSNRAYFNNQVIKKRYLNRARIAYSDPDVLSEFARTFKQRNVYDPHSFPLRKTISRLFNLSEKLSFRQNATQMFRDIIEGLTYHNSWKNGKMRCKLFATDIDHPVMTDMGKIILSDDNVVVVPIIKKILYDQNINTEDITEYYVEQAINSRANIILIPHVNWVNGAILNIHEICKRLKKQNGETITIVDGAQALGNIKVDIDDCKCNNNIDFYVGCGQKWMGCPIPIGFARVSERFFTNKKFIEFIFTCDYFSEYAGNSGFLDKPALDTYNIHFSMLFDTVVKRFQDNRGEIKQHYYHDIIAYVNPLIKIVNEIKDVRLFSLNPQMQSGIVSFTGESMYLSRLSENLTNIGYLHTYDKFIHNNDYVDFIRISSPIEKLDHNDLEEFKNAFMSSQN